MSPEILTAGAPLPSPDFINIASGAFVGLIVGVGIGINIALVTLGRPAPKPKPGPKAPVHVDLSEAAFHRSSDVSSDAAEVREILDRNLAASAKVASPKPPVAKPKTRRRRH